MHVSFDIKPQYRLLAQLNHRPQRFSSTKFEGENLELHQFDPNKPFRSQLLQDLKPQLPWYQYLLVQIMTSRLGQTILYGIERLRTFEPKVRKRERSMDQWRASQRQLLANKVYKQFLPVLPPELRNLNTVGPELTVEGIKTLYPHIKSRQYLIDHKHPLPEETIAGAFRGVDLLISRTTRHAADTEFLDQHPTVKHLKEINNPQSFEFHPDGHITVAGKPFISQALMQAEMRATNGMSPETAKKMVRWIQQTLHHTDMMLNDHTATSAPHGVVILQKKETTKI